jgi:hypothetical protein
MNPCPKCGSRNVSLNTGVNFGGKCHACNHEGPRFANRAAAISAWNAQPPVFKPEVAHEAPAYAASGVGTGGTGVEAQADPQPEGDTDGDGRVPSLRKSRGR